MTVVSLEDHGSIVSACIERLQFTFHKITVGMPEVRYNYIPGLRDYTQWCLQGCIGEAPEVSDAEAGEVDDVKADFFDYLDLLVKNDLAREVFVVSPGERLDLEVLPKQEWGRSSVKVACAPAT